MHDNFISVDDLAASLTNPDLVVLDGSWYLPAQNRSAFEEYKTSHIPGARFFDIDQIADQTTNLPHMLPSENYFSECVEKLGISNTNKVVVYDGVGLFSAARVWWMFKLFGHKNVQVLSGGSPAWNEAGYETTDEPPQINPGSFKARLNHAMLASMHDVQKSCSSNYAQILDARPEARFNGEAPEPRHELSSGHMPGAISMPFTELLNQGKMKDVTDLQKIFDEKGVSSDRPIITSCGSGVTAAIITLALDQSGYGVQKLYDGSWTEWASNRDNPIEKSHC